MDAASCHGNLSPGSRRGGERRESTIRLHSVKRAASEGEKLTKKKKGGVTKKGEGGGWKKGTGRQKRLRGDGRTRGYREIAL